MSTVRWGLISTANINRRVIPAIRASDRGVLAAVASREIGQATAYAARWGIPSAFGSYEAMLDSSEVDAVYISLPNHLHAEWTVKALKAGKHVLCEKPFALSLADVDHMIETAGRTGLVLAEAFMYRHHPQSKAVGQWIADGRLGEVMRVSAVFNFSGMDAANVRLNPEYGGGSLWDVGVYPISFAQYVMGGPPQWVFGDQWLGDSGVDMGFAGQMRYDGQRVAQVACSFYTPYYTRAEVTGTDGTLTVERPFTAMDDSGQYIFFTPRDGDPQPVPVPDQPLYLGEIEDMQSAILDGQPNYLTLAETRDHVRTTLALYESARRGQIVHLDSKG
jgi:xylose dehydrogenase (NAD/NADP)